MEYTVLSLLHSLRTLNHPIQPLGNLGPLFWNPFFCIMLRTPCSGISYPYTAPTPSSRAAPGTRMKVARVCRQCRAGKRRCGEVHQGTPCQPCAKRGIACSLAAPTRNQNHPIRILPLSLAVDETSLSPSTTRILVELYLQMIHDKPHTIFHPPSLLQAVDQGTIPRQVLYSILALTAL